MSKKVFIEKKYGLGIVESYNPSKDKDSPILGTFEVKGMTVEDSENQNGRIYVSEVWQQPGTFAKGGKFFDENGKLRPSRLFGSLDHPLDDRAEFLLKEGAVAWREITRNADGTWDGIADILDTPEGKITKVYLEYAKRFGGGEMIGVSSRAIGDAVYKESNGRQLEYIVPEGFELMSFDFVYNPSFVTASATLTESKKTRATLLESVKKLAKEDKENKDKYKPFIEKIERQEKVENMKKVINEWVEIDLEEVKLLSEEELNILAERLDTVLFELYEIQSVYPVDENGDTGITIERLLEDLTEKANFINGLYEFTPEEGKYAELNDEGEELLLEEPFVESKVKVEEAKRKSNKFKPFWAKLVALIDGFDNKTNFLAGVDALSAEVQNEGTDTHLELHDKNNLIRTLKEYQAGFTITPAEEEVEVVEEKKQEATKKEETITEDTEEKIEDLKEEESGEEEVETEGDETEEPEVEEDLEDETEEGEEEAEEEETEEVSLESLKDEINELKEMIEFLTDLLTPVVDFEEEFEFVDEEGTEEGEEETKEEVDEEAFEDLDFTDEELENMSEEELAYIEELLKEGQ